MLRTNLVVRKPLKVLLSDIYCTIIIIAPKRIMILSLSFTGKSEYLYRTYWSQFSFEPMQTLWTIQHYNKSRKLVNKE
jgi:hypothetical protein